MKFLFTAPRFHTNQVPIVKGLTGEGHEVRYFVAFCGATEDHALCTPIVLQMSRCMQRKVRMFRKQNQESAVESFIGSQFVPNLRLLEKELRLYSPDVVICRENTRLTLCVHALCKKYNIPCIMYDQQPYYDLPAGRIPVGEKETTVKSTSLLNRIQNKLKSMADTDYRLVKRLQKSTGFPTVRMTPVRTSRFVADLAAAPVCKNTYFVPFIGEPCQKAENRSYMDGGNLRVLCVGKYRPYKNLPLFIKALSLLPDRSGLKATVLGQVSTDDEKQYFFDLQQQIKQLGLGDVVTLQKDVPHDQMPDVYLCHDVLVLPTKREWASISVIEAMAHGLAVISTDHNGTATYIHPPACGSVFETDNAADLACKIDAFLHCDDVSQYGRKAFETIKTAYSFKNYYEALTSMLKSAFDFL